MAISVAATASRRSNAEASAAWSAAVRVSGEGDPDAAKVLRLEPKRAAAHLYAVRRNERFGNLDSSSPPSTRRCHLSETT